MTLYKSRDKSADYALLPKTLPATHKQPAEGVDSLSRGRPDREVER